MRKQKIKPFRSSITFAITLIFLFSLYVFISASSYVNAVSEDITSSVFRLHVIANSDQKEDQDLKYKVRDALLNYMNTLSKDASSKAEVIQLASAHQQEFQNIAEETIAQNGFSYPVTVHIGNFPFPTKTYGDLSLPAGDYDALRIEIGEAKGQNWWCVMFPPLCFVDVTSGIVPESSKDVMKSNLTEEEYALLAEGNTKEEDISDEIHLKFKLIEFFQNHKTETAKK